MAEPYWNQVRSLGKRRATVLAESLGIRSLEALAATGVDDFVDALAGAGTAVSADTVRDWQKAARKAVKGGRQAAREAAKDEPVDAWSGMIGPTELAQSGIDGEQVQLLGAGVQRPLREGVAFWIRMNDAEPVERLTLHPVGGDQAVTGVARHGEQSRTQRWLVGGAARGFYRIHATLAEHGSIRGPAVQVI